MQPCWWGKCVPTQVHPQRRVQHKAILWVDLHFLQGEEQCQFHLKTLSFASSMVHSSISCKITSCPCVCVIKSTVKAKALWRCQDVPWRLSPHNTPQTSAPGKVLGQALSFPALLKKGKWLSKPYKLFQKLPQSKLAEREQKKSKTSGIFQVGVIFSGEWHEWHLHSQVCLCFILVAGEKY